MSSQYEYIEWKYDIPNLKPGERVRCMHTGRDGSVRKVRYDQKNYVRVLLDGDKHMRLYHPRSLIYMERPPEESTCDYFGRPIRRRKLEVKGD